MNKSIDTIKKRILSIDTLRAFVILLMIWAHVVAFISVQGQNYFDDSWINIMRRLGDKICFTTFLFLSGTSMAITFGKDKSQGYQKNVATAFKKTIKRSIYLLLGYYLVAFISLFNDISSIKDVLEILIFYDVAPYTEFLIPFIFIAFALPLFIHSLKKVLTLRTFFSFLTLLTIGIIFYTLGTILYDIEFPNYLSNHLALFSGRPDIIRFPILQYMPIYLLGLWVGQVMGDPMKLVSSQKFSIRDKTGIFSRVVKALKSNRLINPVYIIFTLQIIILFLIFKNSDSWAAFPYQWPFHRWPPTVSFLIEALVWIFIPLYFLEHFNFKRLAKPIVFISKNSLRFFIIHTVALQMYHQVFSDKFTSSLLVITICYLFLFFVCIVIILILNFIIKYFNSNVQKQKR